MIMTAEFGLGVTPPPRSEITLRGGLAFWTSITPFVS